MSPVPEALPGPFFVFFAAIAIAALAYLVHRWTFLSGLIAAAGCLALGWISLRQLSGELPNVVWPLSLLGPSVDKQGAWVLGRSFVILGREWAFTTSGLAVLAFIYSIAGLTFVLALSVPQGWSFYPFGVCIVAILSLAVSAQQYTLALLFLWLAANLAVFVLAGGRPGATTGALRFVVLTSLAMIPLLTLPRYLEPDAASHASSAAAALQMAVLLMVIGFGILLMMVPFHGQLVAIAAHSAPMVPTLVLSVFPPVVLYILFGLWQAHPVLVQERFMYDVCRWTGVAAVAIGGLAALGQRRWGYLVGYATLVDWGAGLIALGQGTARGVEQAVLALIWRAFSLLLVGAGLSAVCKATHTMRQSHGQPPMDDMDCCRGVLRRRPLSVLGLVIGLFSLAGFPFTPGAAGRWPLILDLMATEREKAFGSPAFRLGSVSTILILAGVGVSVGAVIGLRACLRDRQASPEQPGDDAKESPLEALMGMGFALLALWLVGICFLHPTLWLGIARQMLAEFSFWGGT